MYEFEDLGISVEEIYAHDNDIKKIHDDIKSKHKDINFVVLNSNIVFGLEHVLGILKIINEKTKRKEKREIKNIDIEFLLRICYTDQIDYAFKKLNCIKDKYNNHCKYVCILFSKNISEIENVLDNLKKYSHQKKTFENGLKGAVEESITKTNSLFEMSDRKKQFILRFFFNKEIKQNNNNLFFIKDNSKFQKFLIERAAISLK